MFVSFRRQTIVSTFPLLLRFRVPILLGEPFYLIFKRKVCPTSGNDARIRKHSFHGSIPFQWISYHQLETRIPSISSVISKLHGMGLNHAISEEEPMKNFPTKRNIILATIYFSRHPMPRIYSTLFY